MADNSWEYEALQRAQTVGRERLNPNRARSVFIPGSNAEVQPEAQPQSAEVNPQANQQVINQPQDQSQTQTASENPAPVKAEVEKS